MNRPKHPGITQTTYKKKLYTHEYINKPFQHNTQWLSQIGFPTAISYLTYTLVTSVLRRSMGNLSMIYIAKHSLSASYQEHIWVLLTTCSNPKLSPASLLPSHYLP